MNLPNMLTISRFFFSAVLALIWFGAAPGTWLGERVGMPIVYGVLLVIVVFCEISDLLDGYYARRDNLVSNLGKILDPYADATFHFTCFLCFSSTAHGAWFPIWMTLLVYYREVVQSILRKVAADQGIYIQARTVGKTKTAIQATMVIALLVFACFFSLGLVNDPAQTPVIMRYLGIPFMALVVFISWYSQAIYLWHNRDVFKGADKR